ncbi:MAG: DUF6011 domain-containing protein [Candidatus Heimdallarchaeota archaeon]
MLNTETFQVESMLGKGGVRCWRCGRSLTNPESIEREYGLVCWEKVEIELWLGDVAVSEPTIPTQRRYWNPKLAEKLVTVHHTLDTFCFVEVEPHQAEAPSKKAVLVEG